MDAIAYVDTEIERETGRIRDIGAVRDNGTVYHAASVPDFICFLQGVHYVCGHNLIHHDLKYIGKAVEAAGILKPFCIDTLYWSPLLFPKKPYHALLKDDKLQTEELNNPLNDAIKAKELLADEVDAFRRLPEGLQRIYASLVGNRKEFQAFLSYLDYSIPDVSPESLIRLTFSGSICENANLAGMIAEYPADLAYALALIHTKNRYSTTPPWVLKQFPGTERILFLLRNKPCLGGCPYCNEALDIHKGLKRFFGYPMFRSYGGEPLQELAVQAAVDNKSLLAVFPTGGGKSITFQVPALMGGLTAKGLTVIISPLQSLMKDQVDNLERAGITDAVTINGLLDPIERAKSFERVENGSASLLYISPESLRSQSIERLLLSRNVIRFVIDEAHCFSSWGQDFRVDYLYIGDFIKALQEKKNKSDPIPVSCFTATAKQKVIEDIQEYFRSKLGLELEMFRTQSGRTNLRYTVLPKEGEQEKYMAVRQLLDTYQVPSIIYVSRTHRATELAQRLCQDGYSARSYHGKMDKQEKSENQDAFIKGAVPIMVATSAFGMGVDKKDVGLVIHYDISDSLENYVQEAGRAGRDETISAECYVLFHDEDLSKHFILLNQTKLSIREIQQVWKAVKDLTRFRSRLSRSALEIARQAGWDDGIGEIETKVRTAITALEDAGYLKRGNNVPHVYADGILARNAAEAIGRINASGRFDERQKVQAARIIRKLFSTKSRRHANEEIPEARIDYISDHLGIDKQEVIRIVQLLREENILADSKDLIAYIKRKDNRNRTLSQLKVYRELELFLLRELEDEERELNVKELNEKAETEGIKEVTPDKIKTLLNIWAIHQWVRRQPSPFSHNHLLVTRLMEHKAIADQIAKRHELAAFLAEYLYGQSLLHASEADAKEEVLVEFSVLELKKSYEDEISLFQQEASSKEVEDALFYLSRIGAIKLEGGFLVIYNSLTLERLELDNKRRYRQEDYLKLEQFYQNKVQQIHIVGEYASKMVENYRDALQFVDDYFQMNYSVFLNKYFKGSRQTEIKRTITPTKFRQLFGELSPAQLGIIQDKDSRHIVVVAGPGSGKTRLLVHKLASLMLLEDVKHEQMLMLTFSRAAATEFKKRLLALVGNAAHYIEIKTFHSYCFDLLGKVGTLEKSDAIIKETVERIRNGNVEVTRITKSVLVLDEAQDMNAEEFDLVRALVEVNEDLRVIAVGDDDQNIYEFRGSSSDYMAKLLQEDGSGQLYELVENYRSKRNLVEFTNQFADRLTRRLKKTPIQAVQRDNGSIKVVRYPGNQFIAPFVQDVIEASLSGSTGVLTHTNEEAMQIFTLLNQFGLSARLVHTNDEFNLYNLLELRYFVRQLQGTEGMVRIQQDRWDYAVNQLRDRYRDSPHLEACLRLTQDFVAVNGERMYMSDLESFIRESKLADFSPTSADAVQISTIHKAKGREYDYTFLLLADRDFQSPQVQREVYVAMTRAKRHLSVHYNGSYLQHLNTEGLQWVEDKSEYSPFNRLTLQLTLRDLWLDFCGGCQSAIAVVRTLDELNVDGKYCRDTRGKQVVCFSKQMQGKIESFRAKGYEPVGARIRYIVYWRKDGEEREILIPLPDLTFERK